MRIDTHGHIMLRPFCDRPASDPEKMLSDWAECGLDGGWVSSFEAIISSDIKEQQAIHDELAELARKFPQRFWALCTVNPNAMEQAAREVERCVTKLGFIGVKIHPWLQAISAAANPGMDLIMEIAGDLRVPVLFHDGTPPYSTPRQIAFLAEKHPKTTVILGHSGLADLWRDATDAAQLLKNVWLQPTAVPRFVIRAAFQAAGPQRLLFGTDCGFGSSRFIKYALSKLYDALGSEIADHIIEENPSRLLSGL